MATESILAQLETLVSEGPATLLFQAEEALAIDAAVGSAADAVNESKFKNCLVAFQAYAIEQFVLAVTKLYEKPSARYELMSVPAVLRGMMKGTSTDPLIPRRLVHALGECFGS